MSNKKDSLSELGEMLFLYKFGGVILIGVILFGSILLIMNHDINKKYKEYGYSGMMDDIKYDEWTDEIIPKDQISTYNNDNKYITNSKGEKVTLKQIKKYANKINGIQNKYAGFNKKDIEKIDVYCKVLLTDYLDVKYEIKNWGDLKDRYVLKIKGKYEKSYSLGILTSSELEGFIKEVVKDKYKEQNNL